MPRKRVERAIALRMFLASVVLLAGAAGVAYGTAAERVVGRKPLATLPLHVEGWHGRDTGRWTPAIVSVLGVDDFVNRSYVRSGGTPVSLYVGYYDSQRQGQTIHSPLNCLPGSGWQPVTHRHVPLTVSDASRAPMSIAVNQYTVRKGLDQQVVLYWYQSHGRVIASEYRSRMFMVYDAIRLNRTDGALVRVMTPVEGTDAVHLHAAERRAAAFVMSMFPWLAAVLPA